MAISRFDIFIRERRKSAPRIFAMHGGIARVLFATLADGAWPRGREASHR